MPSLVRILAEPPRCHCIYTHLRSNIMSIIILEGGLRPNPPTDTGLSFD